MERSLEGTQGKLGACHQPCYHIRSLSKAKNIDLPRPDHVETT